MTIDEAIAHAREVASIHRNNDKLNKTLGVISPYYKTDCIKCAEEHERLAEWLEELKTLKSLKNCSFMTIGKTVEQFEQEIRCKAIDDFLEKIQWEYLNSCGIEQKEIEFLIAVSSQVAEQLKRGDRE